METVTLERTGQRPVQFRGEKIAENSGKITAGKEQNRWHELALWRTDSGRYALHIAYRTQWQGELDRDDVFVEDSAEAVEEQLRMTDPCVNVHGFPSHAHGAAARQANLENWMRERYEAQCSELLSSMPEKA